jgi:hypothetical protein
MITVSDLQQLTVKWTERMNNPSQPFSYKIALSECIFDLNRLISRSIEEELTYEDFLQAEADNYLSSIEAHESAA